MLLRARFPIPLSIRTCGSPAYGLPTVFWTWLRDPRVSDGAHELVQALVVEPGAGPAVSLTGAQATPAPALPRFTTATLSRTTLTESALTEGTLGYRASAPVINSIA